MHVLTLTEAWSTLKDNISAGLESQAKLLEGIDYDLDSISQLSVHPEFVATGAKRNSGLPATPATEREAEDSAPAVVKTKMLGEYVSRPKMKLVVDSCRRVHGTVLQKVRHTETYRALLADLVSRFQNAQQSMDELIKSSNEVRGVIHSDVCV